MRNQPQTTAEHSNRTTLLTEQERLVERLDEAGLDTQRFVDVEDGGKACYDHTLRDYSDIEGNYGLMAGYGANNEGPCLVMLDIDDGESAKNSALDELPDTFVTQSPHSDGKNTGHSFYAVKGRVLEAIQEITGGKENPNTIWGEIHAGGKLNVGPGSQLDGCNKCDECAREGGGYYKTGQDLPIATIGLETLLKVVKLDYVGNTEPQDDTQPHEGIDEFNPENEFNIRELAREIASIGWDSTDINPSVRLKTAMNSKKGNRIQALWTGHYTATQYGKDRSKAEASLVESLGFYMGGDWNTVSTLMDISCQQHPNTDWGEPRKWAERDSEWKATLKPYVVGQDNYYNTSSPGWFDRDDRDDSSYVLRRCVYNVTKALGIASRKEIEDYDADEASQWDEVDTETERSTRYALDRLEEEGMIFWYRSGRNTYYYTTPGRISKDRLEEVGIDRQDLISQWED